ncbi:Uncharacterised protein [Segatella copri]|nr:Uncharacterised protein [Segatella copri]
MLALCVTISIVTICWIVETDNVVFWSKRENM